MWDGHPYESADGAESARAGYEKEGFETRVVEEEGKRLVYTRRVASQPAVDTTA